MNNLTDIRDKYLHDATYISDYVQYLENYFLASIRMINNLDAVSPTFFATPKISNLCEKNSIIQGEMTSYLKWIANEMQSLNIKEKNPGEPSAEDLTPAGDIIFYLMSEIKKGIENPEQLLKNAQLQIEAMCILKGDLEGFEDYITLNDDPNSVRKLVEIAGEEVKRRKYNSLSSEDLYISRSAKSLELFDYENQINLYKQNFIQIMAYFDSCIFDMIRLCMEQHFFEWLSYFENVNIKTHDIAACNNFDSFKDTHIELSLKKCYVKDLLNILHNKFNGVFTINGVDVFPDLQEMIGRRNVHIHHNGIVDQMYLTNFNIYGASLGDYLKISKDYFDHSVDLTKNVVSSIASNCI